MNAIKSFSIKALMATLALLAVQGAVYASPDLGQATKQATNWVAIIMFAVFVVGTLFITKWAANKTKSAADFYTGDCGRLHVGSVIFGYFSRRLFEWI